MSEERAVKHPVHDAECRFLAPADCLAELRVEQRDNKASLITGYPAKFGKLSRNLGGFRERINPGAFTRTLAEGADIRALINHNPDLVLGRSTAGTLRLKEDSTGLRMEIDPPDTQAARDVMTSIGRGDVTHGSFRFRVRTDNWKNEDGDTVRELQDVDLADVSVVTFPAYEDTVTSVRSFCAVSGFDVDHLIRVLVLSEHDVPVTREDRDFLSSAVLHISNIRDNIAGHFELPLEMAKRRLALAERE